MTKHHPIECPCCKRPVLAPPVEIVIDHYNVPALEAAILNAVWKGKGHPVQTERIFDAMYANDPNGGPAQAKMYRAFKIALCRLRKRLDGYDPSAPETNPRIRSSSGISIENVGYRRGYRLVMGEA